MITLEETNEVELREATDRRSRNIHDPNQMLNKESDLNKKLQGPPPFIEHMQVLHIAVQIGLPTLIWGPPGVGKTEYIKGIAKALDLHLEVVLASIREPSDFSGLPVITDGAVDMAPPQWARRLIKAGSSMLFLDEISTAPPAVQAALLRVVLDRVVGDVSLPDETAIIAAANPPEQAAGGWELSPPLANRFVHIQWETRTADWVSGMLSGWPEPQIRKVPSDWKTRLLEAKGLVTSFVHSRDLLLNIPESEAQAGKAWPSPRTWEYAIKAMAASRASGASKETELALVSGCVGEAAAAELHAYLAEADLPNPEDILADAENFRLSDHGDRGDIHFAILGSVVAAFIGNATQERYSKGWKVMAAASKEDAADLALPSVKLLAHEGHRRGYMCEPESMLAFQESLSVAGLLS